MYRKSLNSKDRYYILARDNFTCQYCGRAAPHVELHVDHMVPVATGGTNDPMNMIASCSECNLSKKTLPLSKDVMIEKQKGIMQRTHQYKNLIEDTKEDIIKNRKAVGLIKRPTKFLREYVTIHEPLKNKRLNNQKRHVIQIDVFDNLDVKLTYMREDKTLWKTFPFEPNSERLLVPTPIDDYNRLVGNNKFQTEDRLVESDIQVHLLREKSGLICIVVSDDLGSIPYFLWVPSNYIEFSISIFQNDVLEIEEMFFEDYHTEY